MKTGLVASLAVAVSLFTACGGGFGQSSGTVGSSGGSVSLGSALTVTIPPGALGDDTLITLREVEPRHGEREFEVEPRGLALKVPGEFEIEVEREQHVLEIENELEHGVWVQRFENHRMRGELRRLGTLALRPADDSPGAGDAPDAGDDHGGDGRGGTDDGAGHD